MHTKDGDMVVVLTHLSGGQAGQREVLDSNDIKLGRALDNDVIFTSQDLRASAHHAEIFHDGDHFLVRDLDSTNGTYLNGTRIQDAKLEPGHVIQCGRKGPKLRFDLTLKSEVGQLIQRPWTKGTTMSATHRMLGDSVSRLVEEPAHRFGRHTVQLMIESAVSQSSFRWRRVAAVLAALTLIALGAVMYETIFRSPDGAGSSTDVAMTFSAIARKNQSAVVLVRLDFRLLGERGEVVTSGLSEGTGFSLDSRGHIATNYHLLRPWEFDEQLQRLSATPQVDSLTVIFADQKASETIAATLYRYSKKDDLAILAIQPPPDLPRVEGLEANIDRVRQGDEVAFIGFPYGSDLLSTTQQERATTTFRRTTISKVTDSLIQLDTEIQRGLSGSPIFNLEGKVIGMVAAEVQDEVESKSLPIGLGIPIKRVLELLGEG